jgi:hypothetical protein
VRPQGESPLLLLLLLLVLVVMLLLLLVVLVAMLVLMLLVMLVLVLVLLLVAAACHLHLLLIVAVMELVETLHLLLETRVMSCFGIAYGSAQPGLQILTLLLLGSCSALYLCRSPFPCCLGRGAILAQKLAAVLIAISCKYNLH